MSEPIYKATRYIRLSYTDDHDTENGSADNRQKRQESDSVSNQRKIIDAFVAGHPDIACVAEHVDDGVTGVVFDRPKFKEMMEDISEGKINCVIVKDLSRLGRDFVETGRYIRRIFPTYGVRFIAINDNIDTLNDAESDDMMASLKNMINEQYSRDISIKTRSSLDSKRKHGEYVGACTVYGYVKSPENKNLLAVDEEAAAVVREIFRLKLDGVSAAQIASTLNDRGVLSPLAYKRRYGLPFPKNGFADREGAQWSATTILRILKDETYTGVLVQGKKTTHSYKLKEVIYRTRDEWARTESTHEAIIPPNDFATVQRLLLLDTRAAPGQKQVQLFSGLLICGCCGNRMTRKNVPYKGKTYHYYFCPTGKKNGCKLDGMVKEDALTDCVLQSVQAHIDSVVTLESLIQNSSAGKVRQSIVRRCEQQITHNQEKIQEYHRFKAALYESMVNETISKEEHALYKDIYAQEIKRHEAAIELLRQEIENAGNHVGAQFEFLECFSRHQGIEELNRLVLVQLVQQIRVLGKKEIAITFTYQSEYEDALAFYANERRAG